MPYRKIDLVNNCYYHIFNHSFNKQSIFGNQGYPLRILNLWNYYRFNNPPFSYSKFNDLPLKLQHSFIHKLKRKKNYLVEIIAFCLMPNHYHLLLKQKQTNGIRNFISNSQNGYAKYINIIKEKTGPVFQNRFQAILITSNEQLIHLSRYIHLNPYSSGIIQLKSQLIDYPWSSLPEYLKGKKGICNPKIILDQFKNIKDYQDFVFNQADYQKQLDLIKHLTFE